MQAVLMRIVVLAALALAAGLASAVALMLEANPARCRTG
jgi:hypothetical protein